MILEHLRQILTEYEVRKADSTHIPALYQMMQGNGEYFANTQKHAITLAECAANLTACPPGFPAEKKYFLVLYKDGVCAAILDYLEGYPSEDTAYLGWLMVAKQHQGLGMGRRIQDTFMRAAHQCGYRYIKLGCYATNESGYRFWRKNRYTAQRLTERENDGQIYRLIHMVCDISDSHMFETEAQRGTRYRAETGVDYREAELMAKRAFWNKHVPGCNEHYLLHCLRRDAAYIPELSMVAEVDGKLVGGIWYSKSVVKGSQGMHDVLTFGPLCVAPEYQGTGIGGVLLEKSMKLARAAGYPGIIIFGEPDYYPKHGFATCDKFGITTADGKNFDAFMGIELTEGALQKMHGGRFYEAKVFETLTEEDAEAYDKGFMQMEKMKLPGQW